MSISRMKNLIILALSICALCLLTVAIPNRLSQTREQRQMLAELKSLYARYELSIALDALPGSPTLYSIELSEDGAQTAAQALLGAKAATSDEAGFAHTYTSEIGTLTCTRTGGFDAVLSGSSRVRNCEKAVNKLLRGMDFQYQSLQKQQLSDSTVVFTAAQTLLGVPVFGSELALTYTDDRLVQVDGIFFTGSSSIARVSEQEAISGADALALFLSQRDALGWVGSTVTGLTQGYLPSDAAGAGIRFVPVWLIETDAGNFHVNGITREITAQT